mgnify:CR=1 FL=1
MTGYDASVMWIQFVDEASTAEQSQINEGDQLVSVNGVNVRSLREVLAAFKDTEGREVEIIIRRPRFTLISGRFEYLGGEWSGLLAQPSNLLRPAYWRMLSDCLRFFREAPLLLASLPGAADPTLGDYLDTAGYSRGFIEDHLLPMGAAIWSVPMDRMRDFPARSFARFFANHGLLQATRRPRDAIAGLAVIRACRRPGRTPGRPSSRHRGRSRAPRCRTPPRAP